MAGAVNQRDVEGVDYPSPEAACREAVRSAGEYLRDWPQAALVGGEFRVEVTDDAGDAVFTIVATGRLAPSH